MGYIRSLDLAKIISLTSAAASTTPLQDLPSPPPLLLLLGVPYPDLKSLFLCRLARVYQEDRSSFTRKSTSPLKNVLAKAPLTFTHKSTHSQDRACKCSFDFHSQVTSPFKNVLASALLTFTHKSTHSQDSACKCTFDFHSQVTSPLKNLLASAPLTFTHKSLRCCLHPIWEGLPLWHGFLLWPSRPALASLIPYQVPQILLHRTLTVGWVLLSSWRSSCSATAYWCHTSCWTGRPNGLVSTLPIFFGGSSSLLN